MNKKLLAQGILFVAILLSVHVIFLYSSFYWLWLPADIFMHFFGGMVVGLFVMAFPKGSFRPFSRLQGLMLVSLAVSLAWEWFEVISGFAISELFNLKDSFGDITLALLGSLLIFVTVKK